MRRGGLSGCSRAAADSGFGLVNSDRSAFASTFILILLFQYQFLVSDMMLKAGACFQRASNFK